MKHIRDMTEEEFIEMCESTRQKATKWLGILCLSLALILASLMCIRFNITGDVDGVWIGTSSLMGAFGIGFITLYEIRAIKKRLEKFEVQT